MCSDSVQSFNEMMNFVALYGCAYITSWRSALNRFNYYSNFSRSSSNIVEVVLAAGLGWAKVVIRVYGRRKVESVLN